MSWIGSLEEFDGWLRPIGAKNYREEGVEETLEIPGVEFVVITLRVMTS